MQGFNAVVGEGHDEKVIGKFRLGRMKDRGQMVVNFYKKKKLVATNTWFQQRKEKSPGDNERYQIDYILVRQ